MKYILEIEVAEGENLFAEKFFKNVSFVKKVSTASSNEITNPEILKSIEDYENRAVKPSPLSLPELKAMLDA